MRNKLLLLTVVAGTAACAGRAQPTTLAPITYTCDGDEIEATAGRIVSTDGEMTAGWRDDQGAHFRAPLGGKSVEYILPVDPLADAQQVVSTGPGHITKKTCVPRGGYSDAFSRFASGKSFDQITRELALSDKTEARARVNHVLQDVIKRYYRDR